MSEKPPTAEELLHPRSIRDAAKRILKIAESGGTNFSVEPSALPDVVDRVEKITRQNYPALNVPFHSRWRHFGVGGVPRTEDLKKKIGRDEPLAALLDLVIVSVFLDAGAGPGWKYRDVDGKFYGRSEGLAIASLRMFEKGLFSFNSKCAVDVQGLKSLTADSFAQGFQSTEQNPLLGLEGRLTLLHRLSGSLEKQGKKRPSDLFLGLRGEVSLVEVLRTVLLGFQDMWPTRFEIDDIAFGDVWTHESGLVPFHKLSQWLTYSLVEPLRESGLRIHDISALTGLPEYRNGGLFIDSKVLVPRDPRTLKTIHRVGSAWVIEWRALTVALLDEVGREVQKKLGKSSEELPLVCVLEGGTWAAGRQIAKELRPDGSPPVLLESDATVF